MNSFASKLVAVLLGLFLLTYVCYQSFMALYKPYESETVVMGDYVQDIDLNGFFIRDESVLDIKKTGVVSYQYKNAQKISNNATIANIYNSESDLLNLKKIEKLEREKAVLEEAQNKETIEGQKLDLLNSQIFAAKSELVKQVDENNFLSVSDTSDKLMLLINKTAVCMNKEINYNDTIADLTAQIDSLKAKLPTGIENIKTPNSGYFSNTVDGYEQTLTADYLKHLTVDGVKTLLSEKKQDKPQNIGKLVNENFWSFVSLYPTKDLDAIKKPYNSGELVKLRFNSLSTREISVKIVDIIEEKEGESAIVVFSGAYIDEDIINMRFETPKLILGSYSGIIIPKEAIRMQDKAIDEETGEVVNRVKGVNTLYGKTVRFKFVDPVYEDAYVLISRPNVKSSYVSGYDQVIVKGKDIKVPSPQ